MKSIILSFIFMYGINLISADRPTDMCIDGKTICKIDYGYYCGYRLASIEPHYSDKIYECCKPIERCQNVINMNSNRIIDPIKI